jgi:hypothetical protein
MKGRKKSQRNFVEEVKACIGLLYHRRRISIMSQ